MNLPARAGRPRPRGPSRGYARRLRCRHLSALRGGIHAGEPVSDQPGIREHLDRYKHALSAITAGIPGPNGWWSFEDHRGLYWMLLPDRVAWSWEPFTATALPPGDEIYDEHLTPQELAAVRRVDGLAFVPEFAGHAMVFEESRECTDPAAKRLYAERWVPEGV